MKRFNTLAISTPDQLIYAKAPHPVTTRSGMVIGGGTLYPELNFTLPAMLIEPSTMGKIREHYRQMAGEALARAAQLEAPGVVLEFETLPPMTHQPAIGLELTEILLEEIAAAENRYGLPAALRLTPNDNREMVRPPKMRDGEYFDGMLELFERGAAAGADMLSIESVGGKEIHDLALMYADLPQVIFSLCVMGCEDMDFLWTHIVEIAGRRGAIAAGDTACGFGNTAMVLAEQQMIPRSFAAVVRAVSAVRSLAAYECGAVGPGKDCGYENIFLKAITGMPMSMEGKSAACAHLSPLGNIAMVACDLWSNESVQNIKLLGGMAPTVSMEQLIFDCRLANTAAAHGPDKALELRDWLVESDAACDPQAWILRPDSAIRVAGAIVAAPDRYAAARAAAGEAIAILSEAHADGRLKMAQRDAAFLDHMAGELDAMPTDVGEFTERMMGLVERDKFIAEDYHLDCCGKAHA